MAIALDYARGDPSFAGSLWAWWLLDVKPALVWLLPVVVVLTAVTVAVRHRE